MKYIELKDLEVYRLSRDLSKEGWEIFDKMSSENRRVIGNQFITATDSVGANIAEGYGRYHYLDKIKFYYNARASLFECVDHWSGLLLERGIIAEDVHEGFKETARLLNIKLNKFIRATYATKNPGQK